MSDPIGARDTYLTALRDKRDKLDQLIAQIEALDMGDGPPSHGGGSGGPNISRHDFVGMSTPEAIKKFFKKKGGLHKPRAIAQALVDGGYDASDANAAYVNVYSALKRTLNRESVKLRGEWGSAEQYPNLVKKGAKAADDDDEKEPAA